MRRYWAVFCPVVVDSFDIETRAGVLRFSGDPEVSVTAATRDAAHTLAEEFVEIALEGPHAVRCLGVAEELPDGSRGYTLQAKGFLRLTTDERPTLQLSKGETERIRTALLGSTRLIDLAGRA